MRITRFFKLILFIYEFIIFIYIAAIIFFRGFDKDSLPETAFAASAAMFPLMALFIWLDITRYRVYMPLFTAGKCIGVFSILGWSIIAGQVKISAVLSGAAVIESFLLYSYLFSLVVIILIIRDKNSGDGDLRDENLRDVNLRDVHLSNEKKLEVE
jgi:hypothetical protein